MHGLHSLCVTVLSQKGYRVDQASALNWMSTFALCGLAERDRLHFYRRACWGLASAQDTEPGHKSSCGRFVPGEAAGRCARRARQGSIRCSCKWRDASTEGLPSSPAAGL